MNTRSSFKPLTIILFIFIGIVFFITGLFFRIPGIPQILLFVSVTPSVSPTPTLSPVYLATYEAINVNEYSTFTVYWKRQLWEDSVKGTVAVEDFEKDDDTSGELTLPYLTGNGFLLEGESTAQIISGGNMLVSGKFLHFRDFAKGLTFIFPNDIPVNAFSFDFDTTSYETWYLSLNDSTITIPKGRKGFIGIIIHKGYPKQFALSSTSNAQGGISVDNISYVPTASP